MDGQCLIKAIPLAMLTFVVLYFLPVENIDPVVCLTHGGQFCRLPERLHTLPDDSGDDQQGCSLGFYNGLSRHLFNALRMARYFP